MYKLNKNIQLSLNLQKKTIYEKNEFLVSNSNKEAFDLIDRWPNWISRKAIILGKNGTGKTHLSKIWQNKTKAIFLNLNKCTKKSFEKVFQKNKKFIIEDICSYLKEINKEKKEEIERYLLHFFNLIEEKKGFLILTAKIPPKLWGINLPDLRSRILSCDTTNIKQPDDKLLSTVLVKLFSDKQILIDKKIIKFIVDRSERSFTNLQAIVKKIDKQSLIKKKKINLNFVKELI